MRTDPIQAELERARAARTRGNEGMARVCARRAAGMAAKNYLEQQGISVTSPSAYEQLRTLYELPTLSPRARQAIERLRMRVNEDFRLPHTIDLIEEASLLTKFLSS